MCSVLTSRVIYLHDKIHVKIFSTAHKLTFGKHNTGTHINTPHMYVALGVTHTLLASFTK